MADSKITALTAITTVNPATYPLVIVDTSDTSMAITGTTKKVTTNQLLGSGGTATLASATITGDLTVATNRLSVSSTGVQIGTTTNKTTAFTGNGTGLTIGAALAPTIALWDTTNASYVGSISQIDADMYLTNTAVGQMVFSTDNTTRYTISSTGVATWSNVGGVAGTAMTLNSTGLGVGKSPLARLDVASARAASVIGGIIGTTGTGAINDECQFLIKNVNTASGQNNGAGIGGLLEASASNKSSLLFYVDNGTAVTSVGRFDSNGNLGIGVTPSAGKGCLQLSSGINFPATQVASSDANTLDDYEEGTFTPAVTGSTTAGTATYVGRSGKYTKIGNLVQVQIFIDYNSHTGTGDTRITGLPFTNGANFSAASVGYANGLALTAGNYVQAYVDASQSFILLNQAPTGGGANTTVPIDPAATLVITATYTV